MGDCPVVIVGLVIAEIFRPGWWVLFFDCGDDARSGGFMAEAH
jgi:hypothetical protein